MKKNIKLSVVIPCYNEENSLDAFCQAVFPVLESICSGEYELLFIDDGSKDNTLKKLQHLTQTFSQVCYLSFSRNFGKEAALYAGLEYAQGEYVAVMDADLQDPPELLEQMYHCLETEEYDCAAARRINRNGEPRVRSFFAHCFYKLINQISDIELADGARDYRMMTRQVVQAVLSLSERNRFSKGIFAWVGFRTKWFSYKNVERCGGKSKWSFWSLFLYSLDGFFAFSTLPLAISSLLGVLFCLSAFGGMSFFIILKIFVGISVEGWATLICCILLLGGIQLFCVGLMGQYISRLYMESKRRPLYILKSCSEHAVNHKISPDA